MADLNGIKHTVEVTSNSSRACDHCDEHIGGSGSISQDINHFIKAHGYRLLHLGIQTNRDVEGKPWHNTVAILGRDNPPPFIAAKATTITTIN